MAISQLLPDLEATRAQTLGFFALDEEALDRTYGLGKWSVRFLLHHLADSEVVLYERIRRVLSEPDRSAKAFDQEAWASELDYSSTPLAVSRDVYAAVRAGIIYLAQTRYESHGHITFVHSTMGPRTLREEFDKVAEHNALHLGHIRAALGQEAS